MMKFSFNMEDASQVFVGAFALAVPISFSEEAWRLGETLPGPKLVMLIMLSVFFLGLYAYESVFQRNVKSRLHVLLFRVVIAYFITALVVCLVLLSIDKLPLFSEPIISIRRMIVITMPASMGGIIVDSFDKE